MGDRLVHRRRNAAGAGHRSAAGRLPGHGRTGRRASPAPLAHGAAERPGESAAQRAVFDFDDHCHSAVPRHRGHVHRYGGVHCAAGHRIVPVCVASGRDQYARGGRGCH